MPGKLCPCCGKRAGPGGYCDRRQAELDDLAAARKAADPATAIRNSARWKKVAAICIARDGDQCTYGTWPGEKFWTGRCPVKIRLQAHHIVPITAGGDPYDLENLRTTCDEHNKVLDREARRGAETT